jgi:hypothetical protein
VKPPIHASAEDLVKNGPRGAWFVHNDVVHHLHGRHLWSKGLYPQIGSDEWIEYIPAPALVERDGNLFWRFYDPAVDTMCLAQLTEGP